MLKKRKRVERKKRVERLFICQWKSDDSFLTHTLSKNINRSRWRSGAFKDESPCLFRVVKVEVREL